jgi:23S rRNA pseudouridine2605 synthase
LKKLSGPQLRKDYLCTPFFLNYYTLHIMAGRSSNPKDKGKRKFSKGPEDTKENKYTPGAGKYVKPKPELKDRRAADKGEKKFEPREDKRPAGTRGSKRHNDKTHEPRVEKKSYATKRLLNDEKTERPAKKYGSSTGGKYAGSTGGARPDKKFVKRYTPKKNEEGQGEKDGKMRLNKFLSNAGIASRRDADSLIELGLVKVNGKVVTELGLRVDPRVDVVSYDDKSLKPERLQYVLLNKPKDFITTMDDEKDRRTVMTLVEGACKERIYPVGRLDRHTTGLLLFTNDGTLAKGLTHPKHGIPKLYHVELTTKVRGEHLDAIRDGLKLEDGVIKADEVSFVNDDPFNVGIRIHSGKNRIVRRIFEHFGYVVKKLDRVMFAGLTKKDLPRGRYRHLTEREVSFLKMIK